MGRRAVAREGAAAEAMPNFGWIRFKVAAMGRICAGFMVACTHAEGAQQPAVIGASLVIPSPACIPAQ